jgi:hypothetical protein
MDRLNPFASSFRKYTLEWNDKFLTTCEFAREPELITDVNNRVQTNMMVNFDKPFWDRGDYPAFWVNGTETQRLTDPWFQSNNTNAAPFDEGQQLLVTLEPS